MTLGWRGRLLCAAAMLALCGRSTFAADAKFPIYFDLGDRLVQEFRGTYEFKYKRLEFIRSDSSAYTVRSTGDQSPSESKLVARSGRVLWLLQRSGEEWINLKLPLQHGSEWRHTLRGWKQRYKVVTTQLRVSVPAGDFNDCAKVTVSWVAHEHDMSGPQQIVLYIAPNLGIIKREYWAGGEKEHEEVLTAYARGTER